MNRIELSGWKPEFKKVSMTTLLRSSANYSLSEAKSIVDSILEGRIVTIQIQSNEAAEHVFQEALRLGVIAERVTEDYSDT